MKQNITVSLDKKLIETLRLIAAKRSTSISQLLSENTRTKVARIPSYERAKRKGIEAIDRGFRLGGRSASRGGLHDR